MLVDLHGIPTKRFVFFAVEDEACSFVCLAREENDPEEDGRRKGKK